MFGPHPLSLRTADPVVLETLNCDLITLGQPLVLLSVIVPANEKMEHDTATVQMDSKLECITLISAVTLLALVWRVIHVASVNTAIFKNVMPYKRAEKQVGRTSSAEGLEAHRLWITESQCGRRLTQREKTTGLLCFAFIPNQ